MKLKAQLPIKNAEEQQGEKKKKKKSTTSITRQTQTSRSGGNFSYQMKN